VQFVDPCQGSERGVCVSFLLSVGEKIEVVGFVGRVWVCICRKSLTLTVASPMLLAN
jgi:hypothetical protein